MTNAASTATLDQVLAEIDRSLPLVVDRLSGLVAIPSCSFPGFPAAEVERSAGATAAWLGEVGFPEVEIVRLPGVHPYVLASDRRAGPGRPTLVLYAHHDVQPPLRLEAWRTPPFTPTRIGDRLYGRGAADDKGGIAVHAASAWAWNRVSGHPPVNLTVVIEGEEETGSHHFSRFLDACHERLRCDALVIADLQNADTGCPSLTTSLRGLVALELEVRALRAPLHSGMWGGAVADPSMALCKLIGSLTDAQGELAVAGLRERVRPLTRAEAAGHARLAFDRAHIAGQAGCSIEALPADGASYYRRLWREPAVAVNVLQAGSRGTTGNVVMDAAWARIGVRIVPDMDPERTAAAVIRHLQERVPAGVTLETATVSCSGSWSTRPDHPLFALAHQALETGYGRPAVEMGCGASIPFVEEFTVRLGVPALLLGVEDPVCGAHSENESLALGDLRSAIRAQATLFALMADQAGLAETGARSGA